MSTLAYRAATFTPPFMAYWRGLGWWNLYFFSKFCLVWTGALNFQLFPNLVFAAFLLIPLPPLWLHRLRHLVAIPIGVALYYQDTWFPPFSRLLAQPDILDFSFDYLLELAGRLIDWQMVGGALLLLVAYLFLSQWLRLTTLSVAGLLFLALLSLPAPHGWQTAPAVVVAQPVAPPAGAGATPAAATPAADVAGPPTSQNLNRYLAEFHKDEAPRHALFADLPQDAQPFDLLILNICSLSWADLEHIGLRHHPLFDKMDVIFDQFNSATSYSGPAAIRLLRASCGQPAHSELYDTADQDCYLFENLAELGFKPELALNHNGAFQNFLTSVRQQGDLPPPLEPVKARRGLSAFDGSPVWRDVDMLAEWWERRLHSDATRTVTYYNSITLHDGNRFVLESGDTRRADYKPRAEMLLDDLLAFIGILERSDRQVLVAIVPEHGAGMHGDRMQIAGMREIPSPALTHVPVGLKLIGARHGNDAGPVHVSQPTSYLALAEIVSRLSDGHAFNAASIDWKTLLADLPQTDAVSENDASVVVQYQGSPFVRIKGQDWLPYPQ